jgi:hypothetical protein
LHRFAAPGTHGGGVKDALMLRALPWEGLALS